MKNTINKLITLAVILVNVSFLVPQVVLAHEGHDHDTTKTPYCVPGNEMSVENAARAYADGKISFQLQVNEDQTIAGFLLENQTNCTLPISLSSYKMYDTVLSHQKFFDGTNLIQATSSTLITVGLPTCMAQIDAWYGLHPQTLLDSNPYGYPNNPFVIAFKFIRNSGIGYADAEGDFCVDEIPNTAPVITITGSNPVEVTVGNTYLDLGAKANDLEDGDITSKIVTTSNVDTNTVGNYTVKYNVVDSKGLTGEEKVRSVKVIPKTTSPVNTPPVITLLGNNPVNIFVGDLFTDPGATAQDLEDGDITSKIATTSNVNTGAVGSYTIAYNVKDSKDLSATEVKRIVNVIEKPVSVKGKIKVCLVLADNQNTIATSSNNLPSGNFILDIGTTTSEIASSTLVQSKTWNTSEFTPNFKAILTVNDADCVTYENLPNGIYTYKPVATSSVAWTSVSYNDQDTQPVNNIFDFFAYSEVNTNSDGYIVLDDYRYERTLYVLGKYDLAPQCTIPVITSALTASVVVDNAFTYTLISSSTTDILSVATTSLPTWLAFATSTNTLSGTATTTGTYNVALKATNSCGFDEKILVITVTSGGTGGGGGTPSSDINVSKTADKSTASVGETITYTIKVVNSGPNNTTNVNLQDTLPTGLTFVSSTSTIGSYATSTGIWTIGSMVNNASTTLTIVATINAGTEGQKISNTAVASSTLNDPTSTNNSSTAEVQINPVPTGGGGGCSSNCGGGGGGGGGGAGGNGPISTVVPVNGPVVAPGAPNPTTVGSCYYLYDYLRKDFNNNPVEVKKLQVFLRDLEGFSSVQVTGVYDDQTIVALDAFQERYFDDILKPWGHTKATSYTYILTKKKVNEIYCKMAFPVTPTQQVEIDAYRAFLQGLKDNGVEIPTIPNIPGGSINPNNPETGLPQVGKGTSTNEGQATLAGISSTTRNIVSSLTANVINAGKKIGNILAGYFVWPFKSLFGKDTVDQCVDTLVGIGWLNYILILVIIILSYLWYREHQSNKNLEELNKEIDLQ